MIQTVTKKCHPILMEKHAYNIILHKCNSKPGFKNTEEMLIKT